LEDVYPSILAIPSETTVTSKSAKGDDIMTDESNTNDARGYEQPPGPNPDLRSLDKLVGTWDHSGEVQGTSTFEWMEGGYFLIQRVDLELYGQEVRGIEVIGHLRPFGEEPSEDIKSRFYDNMGNTLDYVYDLEGDTLTIWGGEKGSLAYSRGTFSDDSKT
jgi:hypothetical protein